NDSDAEIEAECQWIRRELGDDVPLHFTAFHPDYKLTDIAHTPASTLRRARKIGQDEGLRYVYTGNVHDPEGGTTFCPSCGKPVIVRDWYEILGYAVTPEGRCAHCDTPLHGHFEAAVGHWGRKRVPVRVNVAALWHSRAQIRSRSRRYLPSLQGWGWVSCSAPSMLSRV